VGPYVYMKGHSCGKIIRVGMYRLFEDVEVCPLLSSTRWC